MKEKTKKKIIDFLSVVFVSGETYMIVAWGLFLLGFILGAVIF